MKWGIFFISIFYLIPLFCFANNKPQNCEWINKYNNNQVEIIRTRQRTSGEGNVEYESCQEALARKDRIEDAKKARRNVGKNITGGTRDNCWWPTHNLPQVPARTYKLTIREIGKDESGEPIYESCQRAQARKQKEWINNNFDGHAEDAKNFIDQENERLQQKAQADNLSANEKAEKIAKKQQTTSLIANAGAIAAGIKFAASCSGGGTCNYTWAAISGALMLAGQMLNRSSKQNEGIAKQYRGLTNYHTTSGGSTSGYSGATTLGSTDGGPGVNDGGNSTGSDIGDIDPLLEAQLPPFNGSGPKIKLPTGEEINIGSSETQKFLKEKGIRYNPNKKTITLPNGKTYTEEELNNHPALRNFSATPAGKAFNKAMKGLEKQIADATGSTDGDGLGADGSEDDTASLGGGGFSGYDKGGSSGNGDRHGLGSGGGSGSLMADLDKDKNSNLAGMSVKMGKNRVGVSQDNIFEMIHRRYQAKRKKRHFIEIGR